MDNPPIQPSAPPAEPVPVAGAPIDGTLTQSAKDRVVRFISQSAKDWLLSLLNQPQRPPFEYDADFNREFDRVVRLIVAVLFISGVLVGVIDYFTGGGNILKTLRDALVVFIVGLFLALVYKPFFFVFRVRVRPQVHDGQANDKGKAMNLSQIFYAVLYTFVPWIPIVLAIRIWAKNAQDLLLDFLLIVAPVICLAYMLINLGKAVHLITNDRWVRIWPAVFSPLIIFVAYFIYAM